MAQIVLIFICLFAGYGMHRYKILDPNAYKSLNIIVLYLALPALTLLYIPEIKINAQHIFPVITPWIGIILSWLIFGILGQQFGWSRKLTGAIILMAGFGNTSFVGIPVIQALYGEKE